MKEVQNRILVVFIAAIASTVLLSCRGVSTPTEPVKLIYRDWEGAMPQAVLDAFTQEYGIQVDYIPYAMQEDAIAEMQAGEVYDVVVLENQLIPSAVEDGLLAEINYQNVPNFKNISANFRDLAYDRGNRHSIPYSWGTTGLAVALEKNASPIKTWSDIWDVEDTSIFVGWNIERYMIGMALKSLGFSINSEDPQELELALEHLLELKPRLILVDWETAITSKYILSGEAVYGMGQADDVVAGEDAQVKIQYILPSEGAIMWGDNWTIPYNTGHKEEAEKLINFLLRPEISAQVINETYYWLPNDAALPLVEPELRNNEAIFPPTHAIRNAEILLPLSPQGEALHSDIWERFLSAK